jgi:hypothetical protein
MKKLTQLITESLVKDEYIEDCLIHFEDMGFTIACFDQVGGRGRSKLFSTGAVDDSTHHLYSFEPTNGHLYTCHIIRLKKKIHQFSDYEIWGQIVNEMNSFKRKLTRCDVYYSIASGTGYNALQNTESDVFVSIFIVDKSEKIDQSWVDKRKSIWSDIWGFLGSDFAAKRLYNHTSIIWTKDTLMWRISITDKEEGSKGSQRRDKSIESVLNWAKNDLKNKYSITVDDEVIEEEFLGTSGKSLVITFSL